MPSYLIYIYIYIYIWGMMVDIHIYIYIYIYIYELIRDVLLWTPTHGRPKAGRQARTYIQQLCEDMGCCPEDLPRAMNDREEWRERVRDIRATSATWWWWWYIYIYFQSQNPFMAVHILICRWIYFCYLIFYKCTYMKI